MQAGDASRKILQTEKEKERGTKTCHFTACFFCKHEHVFLIFTLLHVTSSRFGLYLVIFTTLITHFHRHI